MVTTLKRITANYNFNIPVFDAPNWGAYMEKNFDTIDAALYAITGFGNVKGAWSNATEYTAGDRVVDPTDNSIWQAAVTHTSAATGTFAADRTAHATYWNKVANTAVSRGQWTTGTNYNTNEYVYDANRYGVVLEPYVSGASYNADVAAGHIQTIVDLSSQVTQTNADKVAAAASAASADTSEANALTYKNAAAASATSADTSEANALAYKNQAATSAANALTSENNADTSEAAALTYKNQASASATAAATSKTNAATSETNAAASEDLAQKWASNPEDVVVSGGLFSAFHWAKKAMAAVLDTAAQITFAAGGNLASTNVQDALEELDTEKQQDLDKVQVIELGAANVGDRVSYVDFHASDQPDYDARIIRAGGINGVLDISNRGTGGVTVQGQDIIPDRLKAHPPSFSSGSVNDITAAGWYFISNAATQRPEDNFGFLMVMGLGPDGRCKQVWYGFNNNRIYSRWRNVDGTYSAWEEYTSNKTYLDATYGRLADANTWSGAHQFNGNVNVAAAANFTQGTVKVLLESDSDIYQPYTPVQQGGGTGMSTNKVYIGWTVGSKLIAQVDASPRGEIMTDTTSAANKATFVSDGIVARGVGGVGTYGLLYKATTGALSPGDSIAGSSCRWANVAGNFSPTPVGTWECCSYLIENGSVTARIGVFRRIA